MKEIAINTTYITLGQMLKLANLITNGGEAKIYLSLHTPLVDGQEDNRRGRKLYPGMIVEVEGEVFKIIEK